jgi:hypothetical protein
MPTGVNADMLIKPPADSPSAEITDKTAYTNRRAFLRAAGAAVAAASGILCAEGVLRAAPTARHGRKLESVMRSPFGTDEKPNTWDAITTYNNYYEFGTDNDQPSATAAPSRRLPGRSRSRASARTRACGISRTFSKARRSKIGFTGIVALKGGRW